MAGNRKSGIGIEIPFDPVNFDVNAFDDFIKSNGVRLLHYKAIACPIGMVDPLDTRAPSHTHSNCSNGYIYEFAGEITGYFNNNSAFTSLGEVGLLDGSIVQVTFPRFYDDQSEVAFYPMTYDRFFVKDYTATVPNTQRLEANVIGLDKLTYSADFIESVWDANGVKYPPSSFTASEGQLRWLSTPRPPFNPDTGTGTVISVRYRYRPYFYVSKLLHEVRLAQTIEFETGDRKTVRMPAAALLAREYYFHNEQRDAPPFIGKHDSQRQVISPSDGSFSAR